MTTDNLIPKKIKPLLYQYDEYQTYDLIVWDSNKIMRLLPSDIKYLNNLANILLLLALLLFCFCTVYLMIILIKYVTEI